MAVSELSVDKIVEILKEKVEEKEVVDVSHGAEKLFATSRVKFQLSLDQLKAEGYNVYYRMFTQVGTEKRISIKVLSAPGSTYKEMYYKSVNLIDKDSIEMPENEEPSYMMFARANVRDGFPTQPSVVKELLARIDRLENKG
jgi:hypothetical protein